LLYDAAHLAITYGKNFCVYLDKSGSGILNFHCQMASAFLVNYPIIFDCVFAEVVW